MKCILRRKNKFNKLYEYRISVLWDFFRTGMCVFLYLFAHNTLYGQYFHVFVTNTDASDATAFNNSHNIALNATDFMTDSISIVFHDSDSVKYVLSENRGLTWHTPIALAPGKHPAIDVDAYGFRHIVWQQTDTVSGNIDIMYDCLDDYGPPVNISESAENSMLGDVVVDSNITAHIVWVENTGQYDQIYYRPCYAGSLGTIEQISPTWPDATHTLPSISIFSPNKRVYAVWDCTDYSCYSPYQILYRYKQGTSWSTVDWLNASYLHTGHSSIDYDHGNDSLSCCFYNETEAGNYEAVFIGGNGGGQATPGVSTSPVMTTMGDVWSYLFWQEDSMGIKDIYFQLYYFVTGWTNGSLRTEFSIDEPVHFPSSCGAYLTWTQGETPLYSLYFADFGYPVSIEEHTESGPDISCTVSPNPFQEETRIAYSVERNAQQLYIEIYNVLGQSVKQFPRFTHGALRSTLIWDGTNNNGKPVPAGTYFAVIVTPGQYVALPIQKIK